MSESTRTTADGGEPDTLNVEDLFATDDTDISIDDGESTDRTVKPTTETVPPEPEDTTAGELFQQLRDEHDDDGASTTADELADESPEAIMARADEPEEHVDQLDDAIRADEGALDDLLLTERREADGFLWVETNDDTVPDDSSENDATDDLDSLFGAAGTDSKASEEPDDADDAPDDGFSLSTDEPESFDARAATFDDAAFGDDDSTDQPASTDEVVAGDSDADDGDDSEGLAARIRSILKG